MNEEFTKQVQDWLNTAADERDNAQGALLLLKLTGNQIMYRNLMANPKRNAQFIEYQLQKRLNFRLAKLTHEQVEQMQSQVDVIAAKRHLEPKQEIPANEFRKGKRADHDTLPDEIQALYVENLGILQKMRELHLRLRNLSTEENPARDCDRYPFLKELIELDKRLHSNWEQYDHFTGADGEAVMTADAREESKKAVRWINLAKGRYAKKPSEELKSQILDYYGKVINPTDKLTKDLKKLGILKENPNSNI
ncbi:MAG: hypothetical protein IKQ53_07305 [Bacteroidales bacterium]|nr:hypothetical protein [Bacteroidales bacterium]